MWGQNNYEPNQGGICLSKLETEKRVRRKCLYLNDGMHYESLVNLGSLGRADFLNLLIWGSRIIQSCGEDSSMEISNLSS